MKHRVYRGAKNNTTPKNAKIWPRCDDW